MPDEDEGKDITQDDLAKGRGSQTKTLESYDTDTDKGQLITFAKDANGMWGSWDTYSILREPNRLEHMRLEALKYAWEKHRSFYARYFGEMLEERDGKIVKITHELPKGEQAEFLARYELKDYRTRTAINGAARAELAGALGVPAAPKQSLWQRLRRKKG